MCDTEYFLSGFNYVCMYVCKILTQWLGSKTGSVSSWVPGWSSVSSLAYKRLRENLQVLHIKFAKFSLSLSLVCLWLISWKLLTWDGLRFLADWMSAKSIRAHAQLVLCCPLVVRFWMATASWSFSQQKVGLS